MTESDYLYTIKSKIIKNFNNIKDLDKSIMTAHSEIESELKVIINLSVLDILDIRRELLQ